MMKTDDQTSPFEKLSILLMLVFLDLACLFGVVILLAIVWWLVVHASEIGSCIVNAL